MCYLILKEKILDENTIAYLKARGVWKNTVWRKIYEHRKVFPNQLVQALIGILYLDNNY